MAYFDLHDHLKRLEAGGHLRRIDRVINKDTELHPLVRWQYRGGIAEEDRKAWFFQNVTDARGRRFKFPVVVGALGGNKAIYFTGMDCKDADEMDAKWARALSQPIPPKVVTDAKCQQEVHLGDQAHGEGHGLDEFPVPISTPGFDNGPYTTCSHWITKDPDTGIQNIGNYRGQLKAPDRVGVFPCGLGQDVFLHWKKWQDKGKPCPAALVLGAPPVVSYVAVQKVPYGIDEAGVAGGLAGEPIPMVKCKTVDLMVPADAEIVVEGFLNTDWIEPEGPFGESHGYMHPRQINPYMDVTAVTHRKDAIFVSWLSQVTPSESSCIRKIGYDRLMLVHLRDQCRCNSVLRVEMHEPLTNTYKLVIIQMKKPKEAEVWRALHAACSFHPGVGKIVVAVDEDIDPANEAAVFWAMSYRMKPHKDVQIVGGMEKGHAPPFLFHDDIRGTDVVSYHLPADESAMLCNAILKEPFPPISLPKREYMENARKIWEELGLPKLKPEMPWYGYSLGQWNDELDQEAQLAVQGRYYETGEKLATRRENARAESVANEGAQGLAPVIRRDESGG